MQAVSRLVSLFHPEHYALSLTINREARTFHGTVTINGEVVNDNKTIKLHAKDITIDSVILDGKDAIFQTKDDELVITHSDAMPGDHTIVATFHGEIIDPMHGLYPCYYVHDGKKKELIATQFESHHAREVFPCIDEPEAKATFDLTLTTEAGVTVLGNMPVKTQKEERGSLITTFETTPKMSSYLLAWVIGELQKKSGKTKSGVEVNIWSTPAQPLASLDFALDIATRAIDFLDDYFETPYPLPKSDHVALPDFAAGAMENWGLITYREIALLTGPKNASIASRRYAATVIAHELSHQWFGNLVTMKWWNDLWLNESFASLMEYIVVDALEPTWSIWLQYATDDIVPALKRDAIEGVQAIQTDISHPDEINSLFDPSIVYAKGGRLLRMVRAFIGEDAFQLGLKFYFKQFAYGNTEAEDLWSCLSKSSGKDINAFMHTWLKQPGYPLVSVEKVDNTVTLSQEQFFIGPHTTSSRLWPLPLSATCQDAPDILKERSYSFRCKDDDLYLNTEASSHFITRYDNHLLEKIMSGIRERSELDRLEFLNEQILLAQAEHIQPSELIAILKNFEHEASPSVWDAITLALAELKKYVEDDEASEKKLRAFVGFLAKEQYQRLGWIPQKDESEADTKFRGMIISHMLYSEAPDIIHKATDYFKENDITALSPEVRASILATVLKYHRTDDLVDKLIITYAHTADGELQHDIASALTTAREQQDIQRVITLLKDKDTIRPQDVPRWFVGLLRNKYSRDAIWDWTQNEWPWLEKTFGGGHYLDMIPRYIASLLTTRPHLNSYTQFFHPLREMPGLKRNIDIGITELTGRIELLEKAGPSVRSALAQLK